jgi:hypothetical protein
MPRGRQITFPKEQSHSRAFELACVAVAIVCALIALVIEAF